MASSLPRARSGGLAALPNVAAGRAAPALLLLPHRRIPHSMAQPVAAAPERSASAHGRTAVSASLAVAATWTFGASPAQSCSLHTTATATLVHTGSNLLSSPPRSVVARATEGALDRVPPLRKVVAALRPDSEGVPPPPPLSELPEPMLADAIPPLLQWATNKVNRAISSQFVLERFFSPGARDCVRAATAKVPEGRQLQPADLALGALTLWQEQPCCADVLGVLHHCGGLTLERCQELLTTAAAAVAATAETDAEKVDEDFLSPAAQHFIMQAYRWAIYTGSNDVQTCHLLWALSADPRVSYSRARADPLDSSVMAWLEWEPPLVGLLNRAALKNAADVHCKVLGVVQRYISNHTQTQAPCSNSSGSSGSSGSNSNSSKSKSSSSAIPVTVSAIHQQLQKQLASPPSDPTARCELIASCRAAGMVPSREQARRLCGEVRGGGGALQWTRACEVAVAFAGLGFPVDRWWWVVLPPTVSELQAVNLVCDTTAASLFHSAAGYGLLKQITAAAPSPFLTIAADSRQEDHQEQELLAMADALWGLSQSGACHDSSMQSVAREIAAYARKEANEFRYGTLKMPTAALAYVAAASKLPGVWQQEDEQLRNMAVSSLGGVDKSTFISKALSSLPMHLLVSLLERLAIERADPHFLRTSGSGSGSGRDLLYTAVAQAIKTSWDANTRPGAALLNQHAPATAINAFLYANPPSMGRSK